MFLILPLSLINIYFVSLTDLFVAQDKNKCSYRNSKDGFTTGKCWYPAFSLSFFLFLAWWNGLENHSHPHKVFLSKDRPQQQSTTLEKPSSSSCLICFLYGQMIPQEWPFTNSDWGSVSQKSKSSTWSTQESTLIFNCISVWLRLLKNTHEGILI